MFGLFSPGKEIPLLLDFDGNPISDGDEVESLRYGLGRCTLRRTKSGWEYESLESGEKVSWRRMIDASTERQKVRIKNP